MPVSTLTSLARTLQSREENGREEGKPRTFSSLFLISGVKDRCFVRVFCLIPGPRWCACQQGLTGEGVCLCFLCVLGDLRRPSSWVPEANPVIVLRYPLARKHLSFPYVQSIV